MSKESDARWVRAIPEYGGIVVVVGSVALGKPVAEAADIDLYVGVDHASAQRLATLARTLGLRVEDWKVESYPFRGISVKGEKLRAKIGPIEWAGLQAARYAAALVAGANYVGFQDAKDRYGKEEAYRRLGIPLTVDILASRVPDAD